MDKQNHLALWAGLTALFTNFAAINVVVLLGDENDPRVNAIAALITSFAVAASVYAKQRRDDERDARSRREQEKQPPS